jgi:hypothetical protein
MAVVRGAVRRKRVKTRVSGPARIAVIGCSGSGKSTLAEALATRLGLPFLATDPVFWTADWRAVPHAETRAWLAAATAAPAWVTDGNFDGDRDLLWARAEMVVWLDPPLAAVMVRVMRRNLGWWRSGAPVWGGQRMTLGRALTGARHALVSHGLKRRTYPEWLAALNGTPVIRLASARALEALLACVAAPCRPPLKDAAASIAAPPQRR